MRHLRSTALAAVLTISLAACGSDDKGTDDGGAKNTGPPPGAASNPAPPKALSLPELAGVIDTAITTKKSVKMAVTTEGAEQAKLTLSTTAGGREYEITTPPEGTEKGGHFLRLNDGIYSEEGGGGKPWLKFPNGSKNLQGQLYGALINLMSGITKAGQHKDLLVAGGTLEGSTPEKVGGADTLHYKVKVDVAKGLGGIDKKQFITDNWALVQDIANRNRKNNGEPPAALSDAQADALATKFIAAMKGQPATYEFWVDGTGVPLKYAFAYPARKDTEASILFSEWGTAKITPPPPDQVTVAPENPLNPN